MTGSILNRVISVEKVDKGGLKISIYGRPKTGKTRLMSSFPKPLLILGAEDGTESIRNVDGVDFIRVIGDIAEVPEEYKDNYVRTSELSTLIPEIPNKYKSVGWDTASMLYEIRLADILGLEELPTQKSWGLATRDQYGQVSLQVKTILRETLKLPINVVIVAHERNFSEEGGGESSELLTPVISSSLSPSVCRWLNGEVDYIAQCFIREETTERVSKIAGKETTVKSRTGKSEYCLRVGPHPCFVTGFRLPTGYELPDVVVDPSYEKINRILQGKPIK